VIAVPSVVNLLPPNFQLNAQHPKDLR